MNAAILCPGPSVQLTYEPNGHGVVIGVNRAVLAYPCSWWVFTDWQSFLHSHHVADVAKLGLFFSGTALDELLRRGMAGRMRQARTLLAFEDIDPDRTRDRLKWGLFSATAGLWLARHLGAEQVDVYGADWAVDAADYDGIKVPGCNRDAARWDVEQGIWLATCDYLAGRGTTVKRIQPPAGPT
jgi:hypothetical protein